MADQGHLRIFKQGAAAWNLWREQNPEAWISLETVDLGGVDLQRFNLSGVILHGVNLSGSNLSGADLQRATLRGATLRGASLRAADLAGADLLGADFSGADLTEAILSRAIVGSTRFGDVDLSEVRGLESVEHRGPSTIGIDTVYRSKGNIPETFLRGAGVPESFIAFVSSLVGEAIQFYSCFISYSHADKSFARRLHDTLQGRGIRCWLDEHQVLPGHDIADEIDRGIRLWDKVLLCASKASLTSWWVDDEIIKALQKEQALMRERGKKVRVLVPLNLDGYLFKWKSGRASQIKSRLAADFTGWEQDNAEFEEQFERLVMALRTDEGQEPPPTPRL